MSAAIETALFANVIFLYKCTNGEMTSEFANAKLTYSNQESCKQYFE